MEDNMIAKAASFAWQLIMDAWEIYASAPTFILSVTSSTPSEPGTFATASAWIAWIILTAVTLFMIADRLLRHAEEKSSQRFIEIKQATLSALAESANSDEAYCTLPSKATDKRNHARTEDLLEQILAVLQAKRS